MTDTAEDRKSALYGTLITFLVLNNLAVVTRIYSHYRTYYRKGGWIFLEDIFLLLSGVSASLMQDREAQSAHLLPASRQCRHRQSPGLYVDFLVECRPHCPDSSFSDVLWTRSSRGKTRCRGWSPGSAQHGNCFQGRLNPAQRMRIGHI